MSGKAMIAWIGENLRQGAVLLLIAPIQAYRLLISPLFPPSCRFTPTCSAYGIEAIRTHGPIRGLWLTIRRLSRCHPIKALGGSSGYDPVPPKSPPKS